MSINSPAFTGTQVGVTAVTSFSGQILVDATTNKAIRNFEGKFMTSEDRVRVPTLSGSDVKFASLIVEAEAQENLAAYTVVNFSSFGKIVHATTFVANLPAPLGIVQQSALTGDTVSVTTEGAITNPDWDWTSAGVNAPLYCNSSGVLTTVEQFPGQAPVAVVIDTKTILVGKSKVTTTVSNTSLDSLTDVVITTPSSGQVVSYNGTNWVNAAPGAVSLTLDNLTDVVVTTPSASQTLTYNGTNWVNQSLSLDNLSDVIVTTPASTQILAYNGTNWVNVAQVTSSTVSFSGVLTVDVSGKHDEYRLALTGNTTLNFAGGVSGQKISMRVKQDVVGGRVLTFGSSIRIPADLQAETLTTTPSTFDRIGFVYDAEDGYYDLVAISKGYTST
jgi:hypothetical protein